MAEAEKTEPTKVRILVDTTINDIKVPAGRVAKVDAETTKSLIEGGIADPSKAGVQYALTENAEVIDTTAKPAQANAEENNAA
jgi:hypothetical protein